MRAGALLLAPVAKAADFRCSCIISTSISTQILEGVPCEQNDSPVISGITGCSMGLHAAYCDNIWDLQA